MASIASGLVRNKTLKELVLNRCSVTDTGAISLAEMLECNTTLEILDMCSYMISAEGAIGMTKALNSSKTCTLCVLRLYCV